MFSNVCFQISEETNCDIALKMTFKCFITGVFELACTGTDSLLAMIVPVLVNVGKAVLSSDWCIIYN